MKRLILAALLLAATATAFAQKSENVTRIVQLKYADTNSVSGVIGMFGVSVVPNPQLKVIAISGPSERVAAAEEAIHKLDVAPKTIELTVHFVVGSDQANLAGSPVPAEVRDVIAQLKSTFTFKEYRMLDTLTLRTRAGSSADTSGVVSSPGSGAPRLSQFSIRSATVTDDGTIRIDRMHAGLRIPVPGQTKVDYITTGIDQDVDIKVGRKIVVGRASLEGPEKALFLILTAKIAE